MIEFLIIFASTIIGAFMCVKLGEDNIKEELAKTLTDELDAIDIMDPTAKIKVDTIKRIGDKIL